MGTQHVRVLKNGEFFRLLVDVIARRHAVASSHNPQGLILDGLQTPANEPLLDDGSPNRRRVGENRPDVGLEGVDEKATLRPPIRRRNRLQHRETTRSGRAQSFNLGPKRKVGVPDDTQKLGLTIKPQRQPSQHDLRVVFRLVRVRRQERDRRLLRSEDEFVFIRPLLD